jgi:hypothetical protein
MASAVLDRDGKQCMVLNKNKLSNGKTPKPFSETVIQ